MLRLDHYRCPRVPAMSTICQMQALTLMHQCQRDAGGPLGAQGAGACLRDGLQPGEVLLVLGGIKVGDATALDAGRVV